MAEAVLLKNCTFWLGPYAMRNIRSVSVMAKKVELQSSVMGDGAECFHPGLTQIDLNLAGHWAADAIATSLEPDTVIWPRIDGSLNPSEWPVTIGPPNATNASPAADGNIVYVVRSKQFNYTTGGQHGEILPYALSSRAAAGNLYRGTIMLPASSVTVTTTGTVRQLGAVAATQKLVAVLHVLAINGGSWVATVESDNAVGFPSATVRATFTAATTVTTQTIEVNGAITDDYWRVVLTKTGGTSCTAAVALAIAPQ